MSLALTTAGRRLDLPMPLVLGLAIITAAILLAIAAPWVAPFDPIAQDTPNALQPPSLAHLFGTDNFGRDVFSRVIWSIRVDLQMGFFGVLFPFIIGTAIGLTSGYVGGLTDAVFMRIVDIVLAFPFLVLLLAIIAFLGPGLLSFYIAIALVGWVSYARLVRAQVLILKHSDFITAAKSLGFAHWRIMFRHILPNALVASIVFSMSDIVLVILSGAAVSYLGLGVQPPVAEWGIMIAEGQAFITTAWWITTFPGIALVILAFGFSMAADGLGELLGVRE